MTDAKKSKPIEVESGIILKLKLHFPQAVPDFGPNQYWIWQSDELGDAKESTHHPADRCGGPLRITGIDSESIGQSSPDDLWWLGCVVDSHFPIYDAIRAATFSKTYESYLDYAAVHRGIAIQESDYADYDVDSDCPRCQFTSNGTPVDADSVKILGPFRIVEITTCSTKVDRS